MSKIKLFADDAKVYSNDPVSLQQSLNEMILWIKDRQLRAAPHKCFSLTLQKPKLITPAAADTEYMIMNQNIPNKCLASDLGIVISNDLKWRHHIDHLYKQASFCCYQIFKCTRSRNIFTLLQLYKTYIRPKLEYCTTVWSPYLVQDISKIESIQRSFTKFAFIRCGIQFDSYNDRLRKINLKTLEERRLIFDLILVFKIINGLSDLHFDDYFIFNTTTYNLRRHPLQISNVKTNFNNQWQNCFFTRVINIWNMLPENVATAHTFEIFKSRIHKTCLSKHLRLFMN